MKPKMLSLRSELPNFLTTHRLEIFVGMLATAMIAIGLLMYAFDEPERIVLAQQVQLDADLDEAMTLYAQNCAVCHGLAGEGIASIPPLDNPALQTADSQALVKIISRGLFGTAMPAWSVEDGGPISDYQVTQLVMLVQAGDWQATQDRVVNLGLAPQVPFTTEADPIILEGVSNLPDGGLLAQGITLYAQECVACHGADGLGSRLAPALNDPQVRAKTDAELLQTIQNGVTGTLMASWKNSLVEDQLAALLELITRWDEIPSGAIPAPDRPIAVTEESLAMGADIFAQNCARCHGPEGQGTQRAPSLNVKSYLADVNDAALEQIVTFGVPGTAMPTWGDRLSEVEIQAVVGFMRSWEPTAPEVAVPARSGGGPWWSTSGSQPGQQALPSGGQQRGNKGKGKAASGRSASAQNDGLNQPGLATQTPSAAAQDLAAVLQTPEISTAGGIVLPTQTTNNQPENSSLQATLTVPAQQNAPQKTVSGAGSHTSGSGGPPWALPPAQEDGGFSFDLLYDNWRAIGLILGALLTGGILLGAAFNGLRRTARIERQGSP